MRPIPIAAILLLVLAAMAGGVCRAAHIPRSATDLAGIRREIPAQGKKATVLFFIAHDCPISLSYVPEMNRICRAYQSKGIAFYMVYAEEDFSPVAARGHAKAYGFACPAVLDSKLALADSAGATMTPEAVIVSPQGTVLYRGRIDNLYADYGVRRAHATSSDLTDALDDVLAGKPVPKPWPKSIGCFIARSAAG